MNIKDSKRLMKLGMQARVPYLLVGHSGIGKSQITEQLALEVFPNHKFVPIFASQADVGDFIGIPDIKTVETVNEFGNVVSSRVTAWARPEWMPYEPCAIFLDELNNVRPDVESAMLQLVLERRIHTHSLHPDSYICAAINPASSEYTTANTMNTALVKRFMVISFEPESSEFLDWAVDSKRVNKNILNFLKNQPILTGAEKKLDTLIKMEPCPRLWEMVSKMYTIIEEQGSKEDRDLIKDVLISSVGVNAAAAFLSWMDTQEKPVSFNEIIKDPEAALVRYNSFYTDMRNDLVGSSNENIINGIKEIHEDLIGKLSYKVSILEYDRKTDDKLVKASVEELNVNVKNNLGDNKKKLNNLIKFIKEVPTDVMFQLSHSIITHKPYLEKAQGEDEKAYHEAQLKRFETYNTVVMFMFRDDLIKGHKGLYSKYMECTKQVAKFKKKEEDQKSSNG